MVTAAWVAAVAQFPSLPQEIPHAAGTAKKKKRVLIYRGQVTLSMSVFKCLILDVIVWL